jgi:hypothetical protein
LTTAVANSAFEASILGRIVDAQLGGWSAEAARAILTLGLPAPDRQRIDELAGKSSSGILSPDEELEIDGYLHVCRLIDLLKARARVSLSQASQ